MSPSSGNKAVSNDEIYDVIVIGAGNAGFSAASTAAQTLRDLRSSSTTSTSNGTQNPSVSPGPPRVLLLEKAPRSTSGGNTFYTAGAYRFCFDGLEDLRPILSHEGKPGIPDALADRIEMAPYTAADFRADLERVTEGRTDPDLADVLVNRSREAVDWIAANGGRWELSFHRQAYEVDGKFKFWGGLVVCFAGGGKGLVEWHEGLAEREGVEVRYDSAVVDLLVKHESLGATKVTGVEISTGTGSRYRVRSRGGIILATGGFQASSKLRSDWLGPEWKSAHVRGSPTNTGDGHTLTLLSPSIRAKRAGQGSGCHSVCWDAASPVNGGSRTWTNQYTKSGYPLGIMVNTLGERFVDEGADLRNYTYAVFGREVLNQPDGVAWQVWDARGAALLRKEEYDPAVTELLQSDTISGLAELLATKTGLKNPTRFLQTVEEFNLASSTFATANPEIKFDPSVKDGLRTSPFPFPSTSNSNSDSNPNPNFIPKSNWSLPLTHPPFTAVKITCGITFTFDGVATDPQTAQVIDTDNNTVEGLYVCGELLGGLFWDNYPGGSGLTAGTVFGRIAGRDAALRAV